MGGNCRTIVLINADEEKYLINFTANKILKNVKVTHYVCLYFLCIYFQGLHFHVIPKFKFTGWLRGLQTHGGLCVGWEGMGEGG